jgi:hypothetical protein
MNAIRVQQVQREDSVNVCKANALSSIVVPHEVPEVFTEVFGACAAIPALD